MDPINFKEESLNSRATIVLSKEKDAKEEDNEDKKQFIESCILDLKNLIIGEENQKIVSNNINNIIESINAKDAFLHNLLLSHEFHFTILNLFGKFLQEFDEVKVLALIMRCIAELLEFPDFQDFFIEKEIIQHALNLISHEDNDIAKESLHIISVLMEYIIKNDISVSDSFLSYISSIIETGSDEAIEYGVIVFYQIAKYSPHKDILDEVIVLMLNLYMKYTGNEIINLKKRKEEEIKKENIMFCSDIDRFYNDDYDSIKKYIILTVYYIMKSDFSFYESFQPFFDFLFYNVNGFSTTVTDKVLVSFVFKILLIIIDNDEEEATRLISYIGNIKHIKEMDQINFDYDTYLYFMQNSEFFVTEPLIEIMTFNLSHLPDSFYEFCLQEKFYKLIFGDIIESIPYHLTTKYLCFVRSLILLPKSQDILEYLIQESFISSTSKVLESDNYELIFNYLIIVDKMIEFAIHIDNEQEIAEEIAGDDTFSDNIDRILNEFPKELDDYANNQDDPDSNQQIIEQIQNILEISEKIKDFCLKIEEDL